MSIESKEFVPQALRDLMKMLNELHTLRERVEATIARSETSIRRIRALSMSLLLDDAMQVLERAFGMLGLANIAFEGLRQLTEDDLAKAEQRPEQAAACALRDRCGGSVTLDEVTSSLQKQYYIRLTFVREMFDAVREFLGN